ncbi:MAG: bifunctional alpha,alpha-trehalose-phosphate synthase (UDP-forming)/trehalose-phosphatase [Nitrospirota bacterium]|nr:MAG: bifunctional alpha,alpha-trehalose-phosphate synthase (UDP-forming)/trehalose-phosphatase [Nitrospirota bacterium]
MTEAQLNAFIEENFSERNLVIISNREPYVHKKTLAGIKTESPAGGLTSAMDNVLKAVGGTWIAWGSGSADRDTVDENDRVSVPEGDNAYILKRVWLNKGLVDNYYHGYSNQVLWPLCHTALNRIYFRRRYWEGYVRANFLFAEAALEEAHENSVIWIHDYHLCIAPKLIKEKRPDLTTIHFWHIPWPDWSVFRACPRHSQVLEGLLGNDIIGFQLPIFAANFMDCIENSIDATIDQDNLTITYRGHTTRLKAFPISIDFKNFETMSSSKRTERAMINLKRKLHLPPMIGIGVDRLEYTKGLMMRLQALNLFFEKYDSFRGIFSFVQLAVPTRLKEPYLSYKKGVEAMASGINSRYGTPDWQPIIYLDNKVDHKDLVAYYRMADIGIISSIYDGMNLVAKEFAASQVDEKGTLILSEMAGAAEELDGAILVNPYDTENFADSINIVLKMSEDERKNRMRVLRKQIIDNDIYKWILDILSEVASVSSVMLKECKDFFDSSAQLRKELSSKELFLFLDYDGTLAPIAETPETAVINDATREIINMLKGKYKVAIISGRQLEDIMNMVQINDIYYAGNHGSEIWSGDEMFLSQDFTDVRSRLKDILKRLENELTHIPGVLIEDKGITASVHYRKVWTKDHGELFSIFNNVTKGCEDIFRITSGKKVFEIRPVKAWNKGDAVRWIMKNYGEGTLPVYIGDDTTDEDAFKEIGDGGVSVSVGGNPESEYFVSTQAEVIDFLKFFLDL